MENTTEDHVPSTSERVCDLARRSLDELMRELDRGQSDSLLELLRVLGKFHDYSWKNSLLILGQRPNATRVAGYRTWKQLGRQVRKGEKGIVIIAPMFRKQSADDQSGEDERQVQGFRAAHVFDISQTEGEPLPQIAVTTGNPGHYAERIREFAALHDIEVEYSDAIGLADGVSTGGRILIRRDLDPADEFATLVHEIAHEKLHQGLPKSERPTLAVRETEAEAVAFAVSNAVGLEVTGAARDYIHLYRGDAKILSAALDRVHRVASTILTYLKDEERGADKGIAFAA